MTLPGLETLGRIAGKRILLRVDCNVPLRGGKVIDDFRLARALETLKLLQKKGARVVIISHLGSEDSLSSVAEWFETRTTGFSFSQDVLGKRVVSAVDKLKDGEALLLENLRRDAGEERDDPAFVRALASLAEWYVNDAFSVSHRPHASIVGVPTLLPSVAGPSFLREVAELSRARNPNGRSLAILGGAKFETKEPVIRSLLETYSFVFVGGALANAFFKADGLEVGESLTSAFNAGDLLRHPKLLLPIDVVVETALGEREVRTPEAVGPGERIFDAGPATLDLLSEHIEASDAILWNGPLGNYEEGYVEETREVARLIAASKASSVIGGGDTIAAIDKNLFPEFSFVSAAGGAMLRFLADGTLPGIQALEKATRGRRVRFE